MAEQEPPQHCNPAPLPLPPPFETYIVQVPKDQIYRIPPPENASLVEHYRSQVRQHRQNRCPCFRYLKRLALPVFLPLILLTAAIIIFFAIANPTTPTFSVKDVSKSKTEYDFSVRIINPSNRVSLSYAGGGLAVASHAGKEFATGSTPRFFQPHGNMTDLKLLLRSTKSPAKGSNKPLWIKLRIEFTVGTKIGQLELRRMRLDVKCDVKVSGLDKKVRISSQDCNSNLS
ncbi:NDR1/HIN1-like protein 13 [Zingiber officinale]|uniref:Late embryogenesis abundant protein LEA-2 subgroup domain-containing protein n=1 Tax=Zingiber officinale TaxID=94328 RepID=A0A8J5HIM0_ZINOF|nr:NDR1/HIN1-like protein 13 [Zingiber officinale]KAG6525372.1 hypothetical protein ZIOFF_015328 [Zingiber officinale]